MNYRFLDIPDDVREILKLFEKDLNQFTLYFANWEAEREDYIIETRQGVFFRGHKYVKITKPSRTSGLDTFFVELVSDYKTNTYLQNFIQSELGVQIVNENDIKLIKPGVYEILRNQADMYLKLEMFTKPNTYDGLLRKEIISSREYFEYYLRYYDILLQELEKRFSLSFHEEIASLKNCDCIASIMAASYLSYKCFSRPSFYTTVTAPYMEEYQVYYNEAIQSLKKHFQIDTKIKTKS